MAKHKFLTGVGSESTLPPAIIEGGHTYILREIDGKRIAYAGCVFDSVADLDANYFAGAYAEEIEPPHELDCIQRLSEAYRAEGLKG